MVIWSKLEFLFGLTLPQIASCLALDYWIRHGSLPELDEIINVWNFSQPAKFTSEAELKAYQQRKEAILLWYLDEYLAGAAGLEHWGPDRRAFHLMTDMAKVDGDPSNKEKVMVTVSSEAFGLLCYENCREAWIATFKYKAKHGAKTPTPKYDKHDTTTWIFQNKYSKSNTGQVVGGGWSVEGMEQYNKYLGHVQQWRASEGAENWMKFGRDLIKARNAADLSSKKKEEDEKPAAVNAAASEVEIIMIDE